MLGELSGRRVSVGGQNMTSRGQLISTISDRIRLIALVVLAVEALVLTAIVQAGKAEWYVIVIGVLPLLLVVLGVFFGRNIRGRATRDQTEQIAKLKDALIRERFIPDLIIGMSRGGLVVAAGLSHQFKTESTIPTISLWPHLQDYYNALNSFDLRAIHKQQRTNSQSGNGNRWKVLIVDDACASGNSLRNAKTYVESQMSGIDCKVETAALEFQEGHHRHVVMPTFIAEKVENRKAKDVWGDEEEP
jgi:hypoxanthine phosphoribosyltransferase